MDVVSACGVDGVSVRGVGSVPGMDVGVDNGVSFYVKM